MRRDEEHTLRKVLRTMEKEEEMTKNKKERRAPTRHEKYWIERADEETDRATRRRKIISYTDDPGWQEKPGEKNKKKKDSI